MKQKIDMPDMPILENTAIALNLDLKKKKERIIIGEFDTLKRYIQGAVKNKIIFDETRPLGSFLLDILPNASFFADVRVTVLRTKKEYRADNIALIEYLYNDKNPVMKYIALKLWEEHNKIAQAVKDKNIDYPAMDNVEDITLPFRHNLISEILEWQRTNPYNPLADMPYEYFKYPIQMLYVAGTEKTTEYAAADFAIMPLISYYLRMIYETNKYFNYCKVCKKLFLSPDVNKTTICSEKCRKKQQKLNKQKYDDATRDVDYERTYRNEKMYWYNRITKAKKNNLGEKELAKLQKAYDNFKKVANIKKNQVKEGLLSFTAFDAWYLDQRCIIDELMEEYGLGKYMK